MRVRVWLIVLAVAGMVAMAFLVASDGEKRPCYMKEDVILTGIPSNRGGAVRAVCTV